MSTKKIFADYADSYDLYYAEKDYAAEAAYVLGLARRFGAKPARLLDMGCGTGRHMEQFQAQGLKCDGFDQSHRMLAQARRRLVGLPCSLARGNLKSFRNGRKYDVAVSMFAVMGYLADNVDLVAGLRTARAHLKGGGVFIFDGWFGPAVLAQAPGVRRHSYALPGGGRITRLAEPVLDPVGQTVAVRFTVESRKGSRVVSRTEEEHTMRFFFVQEVALAAESAGLRLVHACPFMQPDGKLTTKTWNGSFVLKKIRNR